MSEQIEQLGWLDDIEAQIDNTAPYYVPRLVAEIRRLAAGLRDVDIELGRRGEPHPRDVAAAREILKGITP